jgi:hypothetical protein
MKSMRRNYRRRGPNARQCYISAPSARHANPQAGFQTLSIAALGIKMPRGPGIGARQGTGIGRSPVVDVPLAWKRIDWLPSETWKKHTLPKLLNVSLKTADLKRSVYVIRLNGDYCIEYPKSQSPTLYIGEGNFNQRITSHRTWVTELKELVGEFSFQIRIAVPRIQNNASAYLDCEAALLIRFRNVFGSAPLFNKQLEKRRNNNYIYNTSSIPSFFLTLFQ